LSIQIINTKIRKPSGRNKVYNFVIPLLLGYHHLSGLFSFNGKCWFPDIFQMIPYNGHATFCFMA